MWLLPRESRRLSTIDRPITRIRSIDCFIRVSKWCSPSWISVCETRTHQARTQLGPAG